MDQAEREFRELAARYRRLSKSGTAQGPAGQELAECRDLLTRHVRGEGAYGREALWFLLEAALPELVVFLSARVHHRDQADDLAQKVITAVLTAFDNGNTLRLEHGAASFYEYLYTAARREAGRHRARAEDVLEVLTAPDDLPPIGVGVDPSPNLLEFPSGTREFWQWMGQATRHLPATVHELVFLGERAGLSDAELARVLGRPDGTNMSQYKKRARKKFIDWFGALWVARTMRAAAPGAVSACADLDQRLDTWNPRDEDSFTPAVFSLVRGHIRGCTSCRLVFVDFTGTDDGKATAGQSSRLLDKFRALPAAAAPEGLRRWLESRRTDDDEHRRRTLAEILFVWRRPEAPPPVGATRLPAAVVRLALRAVARAESASAVIARQPGINNLVEAARNHPDLARVAGVIVLLVASVGAVVASQPLPPPATAVAPQTTPTPSPTATIAVNRLNPTPAPSRITSPQPSSSATQPTSGPPSPTPGNNTQPPPVTRPSTPAACSPTWQTIASPTLGPEFHTIDGGAASGPNDIWVVGQHGWPGVSHTVTMHYDGSNWTVVPSPSPGEEYSYLSDVVSLGPRDAWASGGWYATPDDDYHALLIHWDGTTWTQVETPSPAGASLDGITALGPNDIWVVGSYDLAGGSTRSLSLHWDGAAWTQVPTVSPFDGLNTLWSVSGTGSTDLWAVGGDYDWSTGKATGPLIEHWDGRRWTHVPSPSPPAAKAAILFDVTARTPTDAWASGFWLDADLRSHALAMRWNGVTWRLVELPDLGAGHSQVGGVVAFSSDDVWVFGTAEYTVDSSGTFISGTGTPLALHWNGAGWTIMRSPTAEVPGGKIIDAFRTGPREAWGIGLLARPGGGWNENSTTLTQRLRLC